MLIDSPYFPPLKYSDKRGGKSTFCAATVSAQGLLRWRGARRLPHVQSVDEDRKSRSENLWEKLFGDFIYDTSVADLITDCCKLR